MPASGDELPKDISLAEFRQFRDYIHQHSGIYLEESKLESLRISLVARATRLESASWGEYLGKLSRDDAEFRELMNLITINETSFYRFPGQFEALRTHVLPEIVTNRVGDDRTVRFWSAGCSTGEEPYTIAMTHLDSGLEGMGWRGEVMGTDVSTKALGVAKAGIYQGRALSNVPEETILRHFVRTGDTYRVAAHVRKVCSFAYQNLVKEPPALAFTGNWDVIFCRNVTIYFRVESTRRVIHNFFESLNEGGYLFVGHSETLTSISDEFESVEIGGVFLYRKPRARRLISLEPSETGRVRRARERSAAEAPERPDATDGKGRPERTAADAKRAAERRARSTAPAAPAAPKRPAGSAAPAPPAVSDEEVAPVALSTSDILAEANRHADAGDFELALDECQRVLAVNPLLPGARYLLGIIHHRRGDLVRAVSEFKKTIYIDPQFVLAHVSLANIYKGEGRFAEASREYENALRALYRDPEGEWTQFLGGWKADVILKTCERSLLECRKATGTA